MNVVAHKKLLLALSLSLIIQPNGIIKADLFDDVFNIVMPVVLVWGAVGAASYYMVHYGNKEIEPSKDEKRDQKMMIPESKGIPPVNKRSWS